MFSSGQNRVRVVLLVALALGAASCQQPADKPLGVAAQALAPSVTTQPATSISTTSAVLNGTGNPNGEVTTGWFRISNTNPGTCNDSFGNRVPSSGGTDLGGGGASVPYSIATTGLSGGVTYYFCAIVSNASGTAFGGVLSFTVPAQPAVTTLAATNVTSGTATLQGSATPNAASSVGWFRYHTTNPGTCNDTFGLRTNNVSLGSGVAVVPFNSPIAALTPGTTYYYCAIASNTHGTTLGPIVSFTTLPALPVVTTGSATSISGTTVTLNASANPGGDASTAWFRLSTTDPTTCNDTFGTRVPASGGTALGSGQTAVSYSLQAIGLSPGTTYYYCAIASNSVGTGFGIVRNFSTPLAPTVITGVASSITNSSAVLNGQANPNGATTTAWFRYASSDPGACNDTFGSRAPTSGGSSLGGGTSSQGYQQNIGGLSAATTYYFCAIAASAEGLSFGAVLSFTTANGPTAVTVAATNITSSGATLNGAGNPNLASTTGWFRYGATSPGTCNDSFGNRAPLSSFSDSNLGAGASQVAYAQPITGLQPGTTYYFCAITNNAYNSAVGSLVSFTTLPAAPTVSTGGTSNRTGTTATLSGSVNPGGGATTAWFRIGTVSPGTCNDSFGTRTPSTGGTDIPAGTSSVSYTQGATGLTAGTTYFYCAIASNSVGTSFGSLQQFTTPLPPTVTTSAASSISSTGAVLNGLANPNGASTTGWFRYATTNPGSCNDTFGSRAPVGTGGSAMGAGTGQSSFQQSISGLSASTTYYFCAIASSAEGTSFGAILSFTTSNGPTATTLDATLITSSGATLNGNGNPNLASTTAWFRYSSTNPGTCSDSFGQRLPANSFNDTPLGMGSAVVPFSRPTDPLLPGVTYYFCAITSNAFGTSYGAVLSFTTLPALPTVSTGSSSNRTGTTATLNASTNPGGAATTGWFRYSTTSPGTCNDTFGTRAPVGSGGSAVPAGNSNVAFSEAITGLTPGTLYYFCAIASNSVGTTLGALNTFTTPLPPTVTTNVADSITNTTARLVGAANPNGSSTIGWFRYASTDPGTCNDSFGSRVPVGSGGTSLSSGNSPVSFQQSIGSLSPGTTYYYCAIASSAEGTNFGAVLTFTTHNVPTATTLAATLVTSSSATLNGSGVPNRAGTSGWFRFSTTSPGTCSDSFGTRVPTNSFNDTNLGAGTASVPFSQATQTVTTLLPGTTYYFCALTMNTYGMAVGAVLSFTTLPALPVVTSGTTTDRTGTTATLNGSVNPGGDATTAWFRFSTTSPGTCNDSFGTRAPGSSGTAVPPGTSTSSFSQAITGLSPGTTYHYCAIASNSVGTAFGTLRSFATPLPPIATTGSVTSLTNTTATLNGLGNPNGATTTGWFRYSATAPTSCNDTFGSRAPQNGGSPLGASIGDSSYQQNISSLSPNTTYHYCAIVSSAEGISFGAVQSFTTPDAPTAFTNPATSITSVGAVLNGGGNPKRASTTGWFRYATVSPTTCNDSFGVRIPSNSFSDSPLGAGAADVPFTQTLGSLLPGMTYYYCALTTNAYGTAYGAVLSFTTLPALPVVSTGSATNRAGTSATLNASVNPGGAATTGWFRFATVSPGACNDSFGTRTPGAGGSAVPAGNNSVTFSQVASGLTPGTTYFYCALASNSVGTAFGSLQQFTTPLAPTVTTNAATSVTNASATLHGQGNPNGAATIGWFRYAPEDPGACNDNFGSRAPTSSGTSLGSGTNNASFNQSISGLSPNTTYYFCAIASSAEGTSFGALLSFTTADGAVATTAAATSVTSNAATMNGTANPFRAPTRGYFRYSTSNPLVCSDSFGTRIPTNSFSDTSLGAGAAPVPFSQGLTGLLPGTTYYYCAIAYNDYAQSFGDILSFTTQPAAPTVTTQSVTNLATTSVTFNGVANPGGSATTAWFRYHTVSPGTCNDTFGTRVPSPAGGSLLGGGISNVTFNQNVTGLTPGTTYHVCAIAQNAVGLTFGSVVSFQTPRPPTVNTLAATPVTATTATLNATVNPNGQATTGWFRYSTSEQTVCNNTFGTATVSQNLSSGSSLVALQQALSNLTPATTYYFCAIAQSVHGTTLGAMFSFSTPAAPPSVTTVAASGTTDVASTLNASVNPNGSATTAWFRYGTTNPGACNDSFGTRVPSMGGTDVGGGNTTQTVAMNIAGLTPGTTYFFCALGSSVIGNSVGAPLSFTTASVPTVTTSAATAVASAGATLNGTANPNSGATTGWFRYDTTSPGTCNDTFGTRAPESSGVSVGAGTVAAPFSQAVAGLMPATTYYFCAIAQNVAGTRFGAVLSFTTLAVPTVTTGAASNVSGTGATLNGSANPNGTSTTGWFRYSSTAPGSCNDSFGTRAPSVGASLGNGNTPAPYTQSVASLANGTTYYFCAIAQNSAGLGFGAVLSFTTAAAPTVTSLAATAVTSTTATLNGQVNSNQLAASAHFRYSTTNPVNCSDSFGTRAPSSGGTNIAAGTTPEAYSQALTGLTSGTTYYFCAIASNALGTRLGNVLSFTTPSAPAVTTTAATATTETTATLNGSANPNANDATGYFRYSTTNPVTCNTSFGTRAPASGGTALGAGTSAVTYSQALTGLISGTTYYFCALADSAVGTGVGAVLSFTTPGAPVVTTSAATSIGGTTATLNGSANPQASATTGHFRYSTSDPGTCDDTFGTRAPSTGGASLGAGVTASPYNQSITGLQTATTYYFCAIAENTFGKRFGAVLSFSTPATPVVTTTAPTAVTSSTATFNGSANPNGSATTGYFRYGTTDPGTCTDSFGTRAPGSGGSAIGNGTSPAAFNASVTGLASGTTYYVCALASNGVGVGVGTVMSFTTAGAPTVTSLPATLLTGTTATLNGRAIPNQLTATGYFRYGTTSPGATCSDTYGVRAPTTGGAPLGAGTAPVDFTQALTGLVGGTTYYFCAFASNTSGSRAGAVLTFATPNVPTVATQAATLVTDTTATLNGTGNPNGLETTLWYRIASTNPGSCSDSFGQRLPSTGGASLGAGTTALSVPQPVTNLVAGTTYYFCAIASSSAGTSLGSLLSFTTPAQPTVTTVAASDLGSTSATLNGSANPNRAATTGFFRYSTTNPVNCNDAFGTRAPASSGADLGAGPTAQTYAQPLTGLTSGTTYYFCAIAQNALGLSFGNVLSFTTPAAPIVTTMAATSVSGTSAILNGTANPNGSEATAYFRYSATNPGSCSNSFGSRIPSSGGTVIPAGSSPVAFSRNPSALSPGTTYYFCAIASNAAGLGFGELLSFTTPGAPTVTTAAATAVTGTSATLNGQANPNQFATTGYFRYGTTNPGTCTDSFGTRAPSSSGTSIPAGTTPVSYSQSLSGLAGGVTYYYCAAATNSSGTRFGAVLSFTTPTVPTVTTIVATAVANTIATLNGSANPNLADTTGYFRYGTTDPGTCSDTFGTRAPTTGGAALGAGSSAVSYAQALTGLTPATRYYFCAAAQSAAGTRFGAVFSFTTHAPPTVTTSAATALSSSAATLNGSGTPNGVQTTAWFRYGTTNPTTCSDTFGTRAPTSGGTDLGAGTTAANYSTALTGLTSGTTYYFCGVAVNAYGMSFGNVLSFTTPSAPSVTTEAASAVTGGAATLNGSANPNLSATTGYFRYGTTNPGTCSDAFGSRAPVSGGTALGAGTAATPFNQTLTGLVSGSTYYFCAAAQNTAGTTFGDVMSFTTASAPTVTSAAATSVTSTSATLNGAANPNLSATTGYFRYGTTNPTTCSDSFGARAPSAGGAALGAGSTPVDFTQALTGLTGGTTYYFCAAAQNAVGTRFGSVQSFTTPASPAVTTNAATAITSTGATLNGAANPNGTAATGWFRYGTINPNGCNDSFGTRTPASGGATLGAGTTAAPYNQALTGLTPGSLYYFCAIAQNTVGTSFGTVLTFTTPAAPTVTTTAATSVGGTSATLNGSANPNAAATTGYFRYGTTNPGTCSNAFGTRAPASGGASLGSGSAATTFAQVLTGLSAATTYYFCAVAENAVGTTFGNVLSFSTPAVPTVTTSAATSVTGTTAELNGSANPNGATATGWFRIGTSDPGACNDTFGTRVPTSAGSALGAGTTAAQYAQTASGLTPGTTYYFCAIASSAAGLGFGSVLSFATQSPPTVTTTAATALSREGATLNGTANPNQLATTGWFRYSTSNPGNCDDTFGTRMPSSGGASLGAGQTAAAYSQAVTGLAGSTTYYFCAIAGSAAGTRFGAVLSFTTTADAPTVTTSPATNVRNDAAVLNGSAAPNGSATTAWFRYDTTAPASCNDTFGTRAPQNGGSNLGSGATAVTFNRPLTGLRGGTTYYFCAIAQNAQGTRFGTVLSFMTGAVGPTVTTDDATDVSTDAATLNGKANPNGHDTTGWFRYGDTMPNTCDDGFGQRVPEQGGTDVGAGTTAASFSQTLNGLQPNRRYYYCAAASNAAGATFGEVRSFTTGARQPTVVTKPGEVSADGIVTLKGEANPNGSDTRGWFRYGVSKPNTCDDNFGRRFPDEGGEELGSGRSTAAFSRTVMGLLEGKYYFCAVAENDAGTTYGEALEITVPKKGGGGGCQAGGAELSGSLVWLAALLFVVAFVRRRRRA